MFKQSRRSIRPDTDNANRGHGWNGGSAGNMQNSQNDNTHPAHHTASQLNAQEHREPEHRGPNFWAPPRAEDRISSDDPNGTGGSIPYERSGAQPQQQTNTNNPAGMEHNAGVNSSLANDAPSHSTEVKGRPNKNKPRRLQRGSIGRLVWRRKGPAGIVIGIVIGGGMMVGTLTPSIAGFHFIEGTIGDLNHRLGLLTESNNAILRNKLYKSAKAEALKGCTKLSIACKMKTFSNAELARLKRVGIEVVPDTKNRITGRTKTSEIKFEGKTHSAESWNNELKTNRRAQNAQLRANNMKYRGLSVNGPFGRVLTRFGISKKAPGLSGSKKDRASQLLTAAGASDPANVKFADVVDENGNTVDDGKKVLVTSDMEVTTNGDTVTVRESSVPSDAHRYTAAEIDTAHSNLSRVASSAPPSQTKKAAVGALSILGAADLACSIKNMAIATSVAAKIANEYALVKYTMPLLTSIMKIKAGDATPEDAEVINDFLLELDYRKEVEEIVPTDGGTKAEIKMVKNPNYLRNAMDSQLLSMAVTGAVNATETTAQYMVGASMGAILSANGILNVTSIIDDYGGKAACKAIQNPLTRVVGIVATVVVGGLSLGSVTAGQVALTGGLILGMYALERMLNYALTGDITKDIADSPVARGESFFTGIQAIEGATNRQVGMFPAETVSQITENSEYYHRVNQDYIALEKEDARKTPFDIANQYSFLGSITRTAASHFGYSVTPLSFVTGLASLPMSILSPSKASAAQVVDPKRFEVCKGDEFFVQDVQCNPVYVTDEETIKLLKRDDAIDHITEYMDEHGYVSLDSETGLPDGYTPPDMRKTQEGLVGVVTGTITGMTIGQFFDTGRSLPNNEYAKYLEACVYRVAPYGETGEETGLIGGLGDWEDGSKCSQLDKPAVASTSVAAAPAPSAITYFRAYTALLGTLETTDEEEQFEGSVNTEDILDGTTVQDGNIAWPVDKDLYASRKDVFLKGHGTSSGTFVKPGGNTGKAADLGANSLGVPVDSPIYSILSGTVSEVKAGHVVIVRSSVPGGTVYAAYAHGNVRVKAGDQVTAGQRISGIASKGNSSAPHLHLDINFNDQQFCPQDLFIFMDANPGKLPDFGSLVNKASKGGCSRL